MRALAQCLSHSPLLRPEALTDPRGPAVADALENARAALARFSPEVVVLFGPDHFHGFFNDLMPPFCIGAHAGGVGDFGTSTAAVPVDSERACALHEHLLASGFDPAVSHDMRFDHGFAQPLASIVPPASAVIPIFINCTAPPLPSFRRVRALGEAVGSYFRESGIRAAFVGSGGLSHDVGFPDVRTASGAERERVLRRRESSPEGFPEAAARIAPFVTRFVAGETALTPLNEEWDREILRQFEQPILPHSNSCATPTSRAWVARRLTRSEPGLRLWARYAPTANIASSRRSMRACPNGSLDSAFCAR